MVMTVFTPVFFHFFDKGCHILRLNVICEQRHVFRLTIFKFQGKYIWRLVGLTESDAQRNPKSRPPDPTEKRGVSSWEFFFFINV